MPLPLKPLFFSLAIAAAAGSLAYPRLTSKLHRWQTTRKATATVAQLSPTLHEGDLIFHTSQSAQSQAIQLATHSSYSHCGLLYKTNGEWQVFEAVQPVKLTPLARWAARGRVGISW
ncbi:YiiX/YebB-like N1pC/P60 family cysteine hydrolase [Hymenobacter sp. BRD67]|uniref:YiiX/YebB-like N1pC/P60 family cysteine hydrolase n=1 Tax=Hymenobacter sp. BRD67 TaxID=2675877 RepID=UPI001C271778|nr:YiiX/YebB-like N1pC/P60 family cysteine hydrolase [Hymenobacter sp. BRD67]